MSDKQIAMLKLRTADKWYKRAIMAMMVIIIIMFIFTLISLNQLQSHVRNNNFQIQLNRDKIEDNTKAIKGE